MPRALTSFAFGVLLALPVAQAMALGFGRVDNLTSLGQTLNFAVSVRLDADESLLADCVAIEVFAGENRLPSTALRLAVEPGAEPAERTLRVSSSAVIEEPVVSISLQITCPPNRLARKFVAFVDPPAITLAQAAVPVQGARADPQAAARFDVAGRAPSAQALAKSAPRQRRAPPATKAALSRGASTRALASVAPATAARSAAPPLKTARASTAAAAARPNRLKLEPVDDAETRERLDLRLTSSLAPATAAFAAALPASAAEDPAAQRARERLQALEDGLAKLRSESQATQAGLAQMQLRLREAEAQRYANPLVFALAAVVAVLTGWLAFVLWRRRAEQAGQWWTPRQQPAEALAAEDESDAPARATEHAARSLEEAPAVDTTASPMMLAEVHALAQDLPEPPAPADQTEHEISVEELIDLEQQAEFFVVLGQDEAAVDLLMGHLRSSGGASPLPYLKLLEIYRRRGDREASERIRERFNRRFNAYAPEWQADPQQGRTLLDYPSVVASLQSLWATPTQAMRALEASLLRRDGGSSTFDLPAYRELLFLFSVARDLAEREAPAAGVDLLLPIGSEAPEAAPLTLLRPTPTVLVLPARRAEVDLDITCLEAGPANDDAQASRFDTDFKPTSGSMALSAEHSLTRH